MKTFFLLSFSVLLMLSGCGETSAGNNGANATPPPIETSTGCRVPKLSKPEVRPMLVVRISYKNVQLVDDADAWSALLFGNDPHELNHYYRTISGGRFSFEPADETDGKHDGIVTVSLPKNHPDSGYGTQIHPDLAAALEQADPFVDFHAYDRNGDGAVTPDELLIVFIVAGNEDAFSGVSDVPGIWAHQSCTGSTDTPVLDGVSLMGCAKGGNYAVFGERHIDDTINYNHRATIGIIAHELGHAAFDLPDLYDTDGSSAGIGYFGLMASGIWGQETINDPYGNTPTPMIAWSRMHNGWIAPHIVPKGSTETVILHDTDAPDYNIALLPMEDGQCFLLENRSTQGYDASLHMLPGFYRGGLAVWHIDQNVIDARYAANTVNADETHKGIDLEEAAKAGLDDDPRFAGDARNLFFRGNKTAFGPLTHPSSALNDGRPSGITVTDISDPGSVMSLIAKDTP